MKRKHAKRRRNPPEVRAKIRARQIQREEENDRRFIERIAGRDRDVFWDRQPEYPVN
jgi:hypothetical protein